MHRFYISPEDWNTGALGLAGAEAHHARDVLRMRVGEKLVIFNGRGREITAEIVDLGNDEIGLRKLHEAETPPLQCRIVLGQAIPKGKNMDLIVQKAVEIGAAEIAPIISDRTIVQVDSESAAQKQSKWQQIAIEAAKQCGQNWLPHVHAPRKLSELFSVTSDESFDLQLIGSLQPGAQHLKEILANYSNEHQQSSSECLDACWARRRFHARGTCASASSRLPANYARPNHPASGNCSNLLPEHSLLRIADLATS